MRDTAARPDSVRDDVCSVVVTYNAEPWIDRCLRSLCDGSARHRVIVVDNASSDATRAIVTTRFPSVHLHAMPQNAGFGRGNNAGIRLALDAGARYVFLFNQDAYVLPDSVGAMARMLDTHADIDVLSPLHCSPDETQLDRKTLRGFLTRNFPAYLSDACCAEALQPFYLGIGVNAAAWFVRAEVFRRYGGFDPMFFMYGEDDDLLNRWRFHGVKFALAPQIRIVHLRQSVASKNRGVGDEIRRLRAQRFSHLLFRIKQPGYSATYSLSILCAEGFFAPLAAAPMRRSLKTLVAELGAAVMLAARFPTIRRHQRLTRSIGEHFL